MSFDYTQATQRIAAYEGNQPKVYVDTTGHPTVGIGFNLDRPGAAASLAAVGANYDAVRAGTQSLTTDQINALVKTDIDAAVSNAESLVSNFDSLTPARQFVVVDMIFNLGVAGFGAFHATIAAIEAGDWQKAGDQMTSSAWYGQVGTRAVTDVGLMKSGDWSGTGSATPAAGAPTPSASPAVPAASPPASHAGPTYPGTALMVNTSGDEVRVWQERLAELGYSVTADGIFGPDTEQLTVQFQSAQGLQGDGVVGPETWAAAWR